jgi:hypothetical protein
MPADDVEIIEGHEEGVRLWPSLGPKEVLSDDEGCVRAISFKRVLSIFDENRRFAPTFDEDDVTTIEADTVLWAIGQATDVSFVDAERDGIELTERGLIKVDPETLGTSAPDVFVTGDAAYGPGLMIKAVASGKQAARAVHRFLRGSDFAGSTAGTHTCLPRYKREKDYEKLVRLHPDKAPVDKRKLAQDLEVEQCFSTKHAAYAVPSAPTVVLPVRLPWSVFPLRMASRCKRCRRKRRKRKTHRKGRQREWGVRWTSV